MIFRSVIVAASLVASSLAAQSAPDVPKRIAKIMAKGDGLTEQTAYKVKAVHDEYVILRALNLKPNLQSLAIKKGQTYDVMDVTAVDGTSRKVWFRIDLPSW